MNAVLEPVWLRLLIVVPLVVLTCLAYGPKSLKRHASESKKKQDVRFLLMFITIGLSELVWYPITITREVVIQKVLEPLAQKRAAKKKKALVEKQRKEFHDFNIANAAKGEIE